MKLLERIKNSMLCFMYNIDVSSKINDSYEINALN